jgi:alpha-glucoside transport system permease protein
MIGRKWWVPWLWLMPAMALLSVYLIYPTLDTIRRSFYDERSRDWVGLENYRTIIENPNPLINDTHSALLNNLIWIPVFTGVTVALGFIFALLASRVRYEAIAKSAIFMPMAISFVAASVIWRFMYEINPDIGTVNAVVTELGEKPVAWLQNTESPQYWLIEAGPKQDIGPIQTNNIALILVGVWMWVGFAMVVLSAGLKGISTEILEAARVDGANEWQILWRIILPIVSPTIMVVATTLVILALKMFDLVWVMTGGRFDTDVVATLFFKQLFVQQNDGLGAALAVVLLLAVVPIMVISIRRFQFQEETR